MNTWSILVVLCLTLCLLACKTDAEIKSTPTEHKSFTSTDSKKASPKETTRAVYPSEAAVEEALSKIPLRGSAADISIKVNGATSGRADLIGIYGTENFLADTTLRSAEGVMHFQKAEGYPQGLYFVKFADQRYLQIILGEDQQFALETDVADPDGAMEVTGSDENAAFFENLASERIGNQSLQAINANITAAQEGSEAYKTAKAEQTALLDQRDADLEKLYKKYPNTLFEKFKRAGANPRVREDVPRDKIAYHYCQEFWNGVDFGDRRLIRTPVIKNKFNRFFDELTPPNQDSIIANAHLLMDRVLLHPEYYQFFAISIVNKYDPTESTLMDPEKVHVKMMQNYFTHERAFWLDSLTVFSYQQRPLEMENSLIWEPAPDVISKDLSGKTHRLFDYEEDYIIVYLFTPSCEHCLEETPKLVKWYNEQKEKGKSRAVYAIALESNVDDPNELANYIEKNKIPFPVIHDPTSRSIYKTYYVNVTPEIYVLNPERIIVGKNLKTFQIDTMIDRDIEKRKG